MDKTTENTRDKRDTFRIDEDIHFEFKPVSKNSVEDIAIEAAFDDNDDALRLINRLTSLDQEGSKILKAIQAKNTLLGDYLSILNNKIDSIGRHLAFNAEESLKQRPKTRVSISEDGIGFICDRPLYKGSFIAARLIFLPDHTVACGYAQIVRCVEKEDKYQVAAKFHRIYDRDRQVIARQVLKSQVRARKAPTT